MPVNENNSKEILNAKEAAAFLSISINQLYKLSSSGAIPTYKPRGGKLYFLQSELAEWVLSARRAPIVSIHKKANKYFVNQF